VKPPGPDDQARSRRTEPAGEALPRSRTVLLLVDVINPLDFPGADDLRPGALAAAERIADLKRVLQAEGCAAIYVNDNFGHWQSDFDQLLAHCRRLNAGSRRLVKLLAPAPGDLTVLKPRYSAFDQTPLELLLSRMGTRELVIAGLAADMCVQFSAADAFVRGFKLWVPEDCIAAESPERQALALAWMKTTLRARIGPSTARTARTAGATGTPRTTGTKGDARARRRAG
jgi:nicotinamidase-related amidase